MVMDQSMESTIHDQDFEDSLSFCDLIIADGSDGINVGEETLGRTSASSQELFEFFSSATAASFKPANELIVFCGKMIREEEEGEIPLNEYQKRDYLCILRSASSRFGKSGESSIHGEDERYISRNRSLSLRHSSGADPIYRSYLSAATTASNIHHHVQKVNITALTSMSAKSRRRMYMFGPVKFKPEMELSAIKQRQSRRRPPIPMFSDGDRAVTKVAAAGSETKKTASESSHQWGLVRSLRCRPHFSTVLARSLGCLPLAGVGVESMLRVAK